MGWLSLLVAYENTARRYVQGKMLEMNQDFFVLVRMTRTTPAPPTAINTRTIHQGKVIASGWSMTEGEVLSGSVEGAVVSSTTAVS